MSLVDNNFCPSLVNITHGLLLIKMSRVTAADRYSDARVFCVFNPANSLFSVEEL